MDRRDRHNEIYRVGGHGGFSLLHAAFVANGTTERRGMSREIDDGRTYWVSALWIRARSFAILVVATIQPYESRMWRPTVDDLATFASRQNCSNAARASRNKYSPRTSVQSQDRKRNEKKYVCAEIRALSRITRFVFVLCFTR